MKPTERRYPQRHSPPMPTLDRLQHLTFILFVPLVCSLAYEIAHDQQQSAALDRATSELSALKRALEDQQMRTAYSQSKRGRCSSTVAFNTGESVVRDEAIDLPSAEASDAQISTDNTPSSEGEISRPVDATEAVLANRFAREPRDSSWAERTEEALSHDITEALAGFSQVDSIECHTRQCQVHLIHADDEVHRLFMEQFLAAEASEEWSGAFITPTIRVLPQGRIETVTYLARSGYSIQASDDADDSESRQ